MYFFSFSQHRKAGCKKVEFMRVGGIVGPEFTAQVAPISRAAAAYLHKQAKKIPFLSVL